MNANELADWLDNIANLKDWGELTKYYKNRLKNAATMLLQQQFEIEELKTCLIVEQEHNERTEAILRKAQEETTQSVMAQHCTCYKLGYSPLNDYALVKQK